MGRGCETAGLYLSPSVDTIFTLHKTWHMNPAGLSSYYGGHYSTLYICLYLAALNPKRNPARKNPSLLYHHALILSRGCVPWPNSRGQTVRPNTRETSINSTVVQARSGANPRVDFGVHAPSERVAPATPYRSGPEDRSPPVFCVRLAGIVSAESVNTKFFLRRRGLTISRSVGAGI